MPSLTPAPLASLVTASSDGTARVWDAASGRPAGEPLHHEGGVGAASASAAMPASPPALRRSRTSPPTTEAPTVLRQPVIVKSHLVPRGSAPLEFLLPPYGDEAADVEGPPPSDDGAQAVSGEARGSRRYPRRSSPRATRQAGELASKARSYKFCTTHRFAVTCGDPKTRVKYWCLGSYLVGTPGFEPGTP